MSDYIGVYIHIPFCRRRCIYCDFTVIDTNNKVMPNLFETYTNCLNTEISLRFNHIRNVRNIRDIKTLYLGGGTPSFIGTEFLKNILESVYRFVSPSQLVETTIEVNPEDVSYEFSKFLVDYGISRVSLGIQSMDDECLKMLSRRNTREMNERAIKILQDSGIKNINCDIIFGIPNSQSSQVIRTLEELVRFDIKHISAYSLTVEEYTPLHLMVSRNIIAAKEDVDEEFIEIHSFLTSSGFEHYEISNYSKVGYESKHNLLYWNRNEYIGLGLGAWGFIENRRYQNEFRFRLYKDRLEMGELPTIFEENIDSHKAFEEVVMLGFRTKDGIKLDEIRKHLDAFSFSKFLEEIKKFEGEFLGVRDGRVIPTIKGWLFSDYIVSCLISVV